MADILIKGMEMPKEGGVIVIYKEGNSFYTTKAGEGKRYPIIPIPSHGRLINADELYEKTAELEAQALHLVGSSDEWRKWSTILAERTAFKYDVADAPTVIEASEEVAKHE